MYRCWYMFGYVRKYVEVHRIDVVKDGFWVNSRMEYTPGSDASIWIPPGKILYVEKVTANDVR